MLIANATAKANAQANAKVKIAEAETEALKAELEKLNNENSQLTVKAKQTAPYTQPSDPVTVLTTKWYQFCSAILFRSGLWESKGLSPKRYQTCSSWVLGSCLDPGLLVPMLSWPLAAGLLAYGCRALA